MTQETVPREWWEKLKEHLEAWQNWKDNPMIVGMNLYKQLETIEFTTKGILEEMLRIEGEK